MLATIGRATASGQHVSNARGLSLNPYFSAVTSDRLQFPFGRILDTGPTSYDSDANGIGLGISSGFGLSETFLVFARGEHVVMQNEHDRYVTLQRAELGARRVFGDPRTRWRPFLHASLALLRFREKTGPSVVSTIGPGFSLGAGGDYFITARWSVTGQLDGGGAVFTSANRNGRSEDIEGRMRPAVFQLHAGVTYHPF